MRNLTKHLPDASGFELKHIFVEPGKTISLKKDFDPAYSGNFRVKEETLIELGLNIEQLACQQDITRMTRTPCWWSFKPWMPLAKTVRSST
jgi:hypothetical protein